jgi:hypothetical protein
MKKIILTSLALALGACGGSEDLNGQAVGSSSSSVSSINETSTNNDSISNAQLVNLGSRISGFAGSLDIYDFYKFTAEYDQVIEISLSADSNSDLDIYVVNSSNVVLGYSNNYGSAEEIELLAPYNGTYYVYVYYYDGDGSDYELIIKEGN